MCTAKCLVHRRVLFWQTRYVPASSGGGDTAIGCAADVAVVKLLKITPGERGQAEALGMLRREVSMSLSLDALRLRHVVKVRVLPRQRSLAARALTVLPCLLGHIHLLSRAATARCAGLRLHAVPRRRATAAIAAGRLGIRGGDGALRHGQCRVYDQEAGCKVRRDRLRVSCKCALACCLQACSAAACSCSRLPCRAFTAACQNQAM